MDHLPGVEVVVSVPLKILQFLWTCIKYIGYGIVSVVSAIWAGILALFAWIAEWDWEAIGEFFLNCLSFPFVVIGWIIAKTFSLLKVIFKKAISLLKWFFETFADVLVWTIKLIIFLVTLRFIVDPSSVSELFKSKSEDKK